MVLHVARRALAAGAREVWVATDDARIVDALQDSGVQVVMTSAEHQSGTDRLAECSRIAAVVPINTPSITSGPVSDGSCTLVS